MLTIDRVTKQFGRLRAVDRVSFDIRRGEIFALLGPNGAGKTTLVRMLLGLLRPDQGAFHWDGGKPDPARLGYLPEDRGLYRDRPVASTLTYFGALRGLSHHDAEHAATRWLERLGLRERARERLDALSKGNQQKVQIAAAILHRPDFAVLDEPFSGFDPVNQETILGLLRELRDEGMTLLLSAHQMPLVERLADRVVLLDRGRAVLDGTLDEVRARAGAAMKLVLSADAGDPTLVAGHRAVTAFEREAHGRYAMTLSSPADLPDVLSVALGTLRVTAVHSDRLSLHDVYVRAVGARETGGAA